MKLYIIGNGFDLYHGLKTSFADFKKFINSIDSSIIDKWQEIISIDLDENWANIEKSFEYVDYYELYDKCSSLLIGYGEDNWKDSYHHDYEYEIEKYLQLSINSNEYLTKWLNNIDTLLSPKLKLDKNALFLTFNYTNVLEECYKVSLNKICHIHGSYINNNMVLGHNNVDVYKQLLDVDDNELDVRITSGNKIMNKSNRTSFKNSNKYIEENIEFFNRISNVTEVVIIGHSLNALSGVDRDYYTKIRKIIKNDNIKVTVIYYKENTDDYKQELNDLGFKNVNFFGYDYIEI